MAFIAVFLNHSVYVPMLWVGVDQFFVLSGFLITNILLAAKQKSAREFFGVFYRRRVQRILPPYFIVLGLVALAPVDIDWAAIWWHFLLFVQNFSVAFQYRTGVLNPYWSLAVEEQYYLFWPLLCFFLTRRQLLAACVVFLFASPLLRAFATLHADSYLVVFTLTPFRMDQLAAGSLLAILWSSDRERVFRGLPRAKIAVALSGALFFGLAVFPWWRAKANSLPFNTLGYTLSTVLFTSILWVALTSKNRLLQGFLTNRALMYVGSISYMCYLVHEPILHFTLPPLGKWYGSALALALTLAFSAFTWHAIEQPLLARKQKAGRESLAVAVEPANPGG